MTLTCKGNKRLWAWFDPFPAIMLREILKEQNKMPHRRNQTLRVITQTVHNNNLMDPFDPTSWLCLVGHHHTNSPQQGFDGSFDTDRVDYAKKTYGPWIIILTVRNNKIMEEREEKSSLCPRGHHTNSQQQQFDGPFWHKKCWLCQKDLKRMDHHTNSPQQQSYGPNCPKTLTMPLWVMTQTVHKNNLKEQFEWKSWLCPVGHRTNSSQQQ